MKGNNLPKM